MPSCQTADKNALKLYTTGITPKKKSAYMVALNDHLTSPVVESINAIKYCGAIGDLIVVRASDDFMVASVTVTITDAAGGIIEQGEASKKPLTDECMGIHVHGGKPCNCRNEDHSDCLRQSW